MKKYAVEFLKRGMLFGGFGPILAAIIYYIISLSTDIKFSGSEILIGIISTYLLAFIQAGASIFNQIENWPIYKSLGIHMLTIYIAYLGCYLVNSWIPFYWDVVLIFTIVFIVTYLLIWTIVYIVVNKITKDLNKKIA